MPAKKYRVFLNGKKRSILKKIVNTGTDKARKMARARILLLADESPRGASKKDKEIMEALGVCARTVALTPKRCNPLPGAGLRTMRFLAKGELSKNDAIQRTHTKR